MGLRCLSDITPSIEQDRAAVVRAVDAVDEAVVCVTHLSLRARKSPPRMVRAGAKRFTLPAIVSQNVAFVYALREAVDDRGHGEAFQPDRAILADVHGPSDLAP